MFSNRRPYYGLKLSIADFFREPVRYLKQSNTQESMSEKPYLVGEYPKMHLDLPGFKYKPKKKPGFFGPIASGVQYGGSASITYGESRCYWRTINTGGCTSGSLIITMWADYYWSAEFKFVAEIAEDTIGVTLTQLPETEAVAWDDQDYLLTFPENANGTVTICGFASAYVLVSDTFENIAAGMPVGIYKFGGQQNPAVLQKSSYGTKGANCGCITIETSCDLCIDIVVMGYDEAASAGTVARNSSCTVAVQDGLGPYNWSVVGAGFTLTHAQTAGVSNTLNADGSACGTATITVTDQCGGLATGYVVCTTGAWHACGSVLVTRCIGGASDCYTGGECTVYVGAGSWISGRFKVSHAKLFGSCSGGMPDVTQSCTLGTASLSTITGKSNFLSSYLVAKDPNAYFFYWGC